MAQPSLSEQVRRLEAELGVPLFVRAGRGLELTEAGRLLARTPSARWPRPQEAPARPCARCGRSRGGTVAFGTFSSAHHYLTGGLVQDFAVRTPAFASASSARTRAEVADAVRDGELEAGLIVLPVEDAGLDVRVDGARGAALPLRGPRARQAAGHDRAARATRR